MKRILVIGDSYIGERAEEILRAFLKFFGGRGYDYVIRGRPRGPQGDQP